MTAKENIQLLYLTYFNRAADQSGLTYWQERLEAGESIASLHQVFANPDVPEISALYTDVNSAESYISTVYRNLLNRDPDANGLDYWSERIQATLDQGTPLESAGLAMLAAFMNAAGGNTGVDADTLAAKLVIAETITEITSETPEKIAELSQQYLATPELHSFNENELSSLTSQIKASAQQETEGSTGGSSGGTDQTPPAMVAAELLGNGESITISYSELLTGSPNPSSFTLGSLANVTAVQINGNSLELTLDRPVSSDAEITISYDANTQGSLADTSGNAALNRPGFTGDSIS
ncbi:DUF4214 domain-containing protein [Vreelandella arctica]|uniref:DUF4214 domain-containing protein n=1 Tax=Vreelandella arctica TaxID=3126499 RepID=UPI00300DECA9